jgi:hypothetical protein
MWGGGYAGLVRKPSGKWCGIIGLGGIQIKSRGLLRSPAGINPLATKAPATVPTTAPTAAPTAVPATVSGLGWVSRTLAVSVC